MLGGWTARGLAIGVLICGMAVAMGDPAAEGRNINSVPTAQNSDVPNRYSHPATNGVVVGLAIVLSQDKSEKTALAPDSPSECEHYSRFASAD